MKNSFKKGFLKSYPYTSDQVNKVVFGLYFEDGSTLGEAAMVWKDTFDGLDYEIVVPNDSWKVIAESPDLFRLLYEYDDGELTPFIFYEILSKAGYSEI